MNASQAGLHLLGGYSGKNYNPMFGRSAYADPAPVVDKFVKRIEEHKASAFIINTHAKGKELTASDITKLLQATIDGSAVRTTLQFRYRVLEFKK